MEHVFDDVRAERARQDERWGQQSHDNFIWGAILTEEVGEVAMASLEQEFGDSENEKANLREELIQVAAVAVAWVENLDRNGS